MSFSNVEKRIESYKKQLHNCYDLDSRVLTKKSSTIGFVYLKSFTDKQLFIDGIFTPISKTENQISIENLKDKIIESQSIEEIEDADVVEKILKGYVVIVLQGQEKLLGVDIQAYPARIPSEPPTSPVIQGPREGFTEDLRTNITLIRRRLYTKDLVLQSMKVGKYSNTDVVVAYINGVAPKEVIDKVIKRIKKIEIGGIIDSYYILSFLQDKPDSLFKQVGNTEKPDIVVAKMLEGRVAIIVDNSPIVLTLPFILLEELQSPNDYYSNHHYASLIRFIRIIGIMIAILVPGLYLALQLYHYNVLPLNFLITVADTTQGLPFTPFMELLFILLLFQILYEVSLRLPSYLGLATSIVGALILGDTGVKAGLISPPGVIVVAIAKIAQYTAPEQSSQITVLQFLFLIIGGSLGMIGIFGALIYFINYMNVLDSYGTPYLAPYSPRIPQDLKDALVKSSINEMKTRPKSLQSPNKVREK